MSIRKRTRQMSNDRFERWFDAFKTPYTQQKFIHSYKALENAYSELVISHLLTLPQKAQVNKFIRNLPKMSPRRFRYFFAKLKKDPTIIYKYSYKDFTKRQQVLIQLYLIKDYIKQHLS